MSVSQTTCREWEEKKQANERHKRDYLASSRVLAPTLRLKPFSITKRAADVAPASRDPLELPAVAPLVFAGSVALCEVILSGPLLSGGWLGTRGWLWSRHTGSHRQQAPASAIQPPAPPFRLELKSIRVSPCLKSHSEADEHLCPKGWSLSLRPWLASLQCEALTHSCPISRGLMLRLILSK